MRACVTPLRSTYNAGGGIKQRQEWSRKVACALLWRTRACVCARRSHPLVPPCDDGGPGVAAAPVGAGAVSQHVEEEGFGVVLDDLAVLAGLESAGEFLVALAGDVQGFLAGVTADEVA